MDVLAVIGPALAAWTVWLARDGRVSRRWIAPAVLGAIAIAAAFVIASTRIARAFDDVSNVSADQRQRFLSSEIADAQWLRAGALAAAAAWGLALAIATIRATRRD